MSRIYVADDGLSRCHWASLAPDFPRYHDTEWGFPVGDDRTLFEKLCLEAFQSGLSWRTILDKREGFRAAFANFDIARVATFDDADVARLLADAGIVRHRGKIEAAIHNARRALDVIAEHGSLAAYVWSFEPDPATLPAPQAATTVPAAQALAKDLKKRGWKFVGPTTVFAFMQAMGLVNDHAEGCCIRARVADARLGFVVPRRTG